MPEALKWDSKIIIIKKETVEGTDSVPTGVNGFLMYDVGFTPMKGKDVTIDYELPYIGNDPSRASALHGTLTGKISLSGSGTAGTAPAWSAAMEICGVSETVSPGVSVVYRPISSAMASATYGFWIEGTHFRYLGSRSSGKLVWPLQDNPYLEIELTGIFTDPAEVARVTPTLSGFKLPEIVTKSNVTAFTMNAVPLNARSISLDFGNVVETRHLSLSERVLITDRKDMLQAQVEAVPLGTFNPFALAKASTKFAVNFTHGTVGGNIFNLAMPAVQLTRPEKFANVQKIVEWPLSAKVLPVSGNDQWTLTLT